MLSRDTPPSNQDGPFGIGETTSDFALETGEQDEIGLDPVTARKLAQECYEASTNWLNSGKRARWTESLRAFQNLHPTNSKYYSRDYGFRTDLYRPKTRTMVRKAEAQTAAAFFSNEDVVNIQASDEDNEQQAANAQLLKELIQFRLTRTIPWFLTLVGARQDCEVMGLCAAKTYWKYEEAYRSTEDEVLSDPETGSPIRDAMGKLQLRQVEVVEKIHDKPVIDLFAPENLRFEPGCDWRDPVGSSPYLIYQIPMYVADVRGMIESGRWFDVDEGALRNSTDLDDDTTRRAREPGRVPGKDNDAWKPQDFDISWVHENIIRWNGQDWQFFTLGRQATLLTNPRPLNEVYLHGIRPFAIGYVTIETHKNYPASKVELVRDLQRATNDDWNLRFDQVKLSLQPRQFVREGSGIEIIDVRTFIPGKVIMTQKPAEDVVWDRPPEPGATAYQEQDRINLDFDELTGDYSNTSVMSSQLEQQSATGMHLMSGQASGMNEYELRVFAETFVEKVLYQLVRLEQAYETDETILEICGKRAKLFEKYGVSKVTDALLSEEANVKVNVGIGATNPTIKLQRFATAAKMVQELFGSALAMGINVEEVVHEVFGLAGYKDGDRFFVPGFDFQGAIRQAMQAQQQAGKQPNSGQNDALRLQIAETTAQGKIREREISAQSDARSDAMELEKVRLQEQMENVRTFMGHAKDLIAPHTAPREPAVVVPHPAMGGRGF